MVSNAELQQQVEDLCGLVQQLQQAQWTRGAGSRVQVQIDPRPCLLKYENWGSVTAIPMPAQRSRSDRTVSFSLPLFPLPDTARCMTLG